MYSVCENTVDPDQLASDDEVTGIVQHEIIHEIMHVNKKKTNILLKTSFASVTNIMYFCYWWKN